MVQYANGTIEMIKLDVPTGTQDAMVQSPEEMYRRGRHDARLYYRGRGVFWGSVAAGATSLVTGGVALTIPAAMAVTPPSRGTLRVPDVNLAQNQDYMKGYRKQAHIRKVGKAAAGAGTGIVAGFGILIGMVMFVVL
jgi:hypothetical protein